MLRAVADVHDRWADVHGDTTPYRPGDAGRPGTDLPLWQATVSAPAVAQDQLWGDLDAILADWRAA